MNASHHIGRVGGLAAALGIGVAMLACGPVASADDESAAGQQVQTPSASEQSESPATTASAPVTPANADPQPSVTPTPPPTVQRRLSPVLRFPTPVQSAAASAKSRRPQPADAVRQRGLAPRPSSALTPGVTGITVSAALPSPAAPEPAAAVSVEVARAPEAAAPPPPPPAATAPSAPAPLVTVIPRLVTRVVTEMLSVLGLSTSAGGAPVAPVETPVLWGLLAWTRRQSEQTVDARSVAPAATLATPAAALTAAAVGTQPVAWVTGTGLVGSYPVVARANDTGRLFSIWGTDLGIMWDNGVTADNPATVAVEEQQVLMLFGDTFSGPNMSGAWRSNVLLRSIDRNLADGITVGPGRVGDPLSGGVVSSSNFAKQVIYGRAGTLGWLGSEVTIIPTSAIALPYANSFGSRQYASVMSVKSWDTPGRWTTNYSAIAYSDDNGQTWTVAPGTVRSAGFLRTTNGYVSGNQNFQMNAFVRPPADAADAGYVYMYGTPSGRGGTIYLSRVQQSGVLDQTRYEYWTGTGWALNKPSAAKPVLPATTTSGTGLFGWLTRSTSYPSAGEMSVQYNTYLKKYVMMYADSSNNVVMRTADRPEGTWSAPVTVATSLKYPGLYAPMMHPWSTGQDIYWNMSMWGDYNVVLMRTTLA